jgi:hypothetical protein
VRSLGVVLDPPVLDRSPRVSHGQEPVLVQALVAELAIEALDVRVLENDLAAVSDILVEECWIV